jgi:hypothetical protein
MKIIGKHKWVSNAIITESFDEKTEDKSLPSYRRFTATICGFRNFKIYEGELKADTAQKVKQKVTEIRNKIESGDESVFHHKGYFLT